MWAGVLTVSAGIFAMITAEQLPVGLVPAISKDLDVSVGTAGLTVTVPGVVAAFASIAIPLVVGRLDRRTLLAGLLAVMVIGAAASASAAGFSALIACRVLVGVTIGGFWAVAGSLAVRLVPEPSVPRALVIVFGGVGAAAVLGVPLGTVIGHLLGWRGAFLALGGLTLAIMLAALLLLPPLPATEPVRLPVLKARLQDRRLVAGVIATALLVAGHYGAYTFVSPVLQHVCGVDGGLVGPLLLGYGLAGLVGNAVAGRPAARATGPTLATIAFALGLALLLLAAVGGSPVTGALLLVAWGLAYGAAPVTLQTWMLKAAPEHGEAATAIYCFVFNLAIAVGALATSLAVDGTGLRAAPWIGAGLVLLVPLTIRQAPGAARK